MTDNTEHPFAPYVRILGKGKKASRSLTFNEALDAMSMILAGEVEDVQLGAFLMLLRVKEESPEELAGFTQAVKQTLPSSNALAQLDWPSYAGKNKQLPWYILSMLLLAENKLSILCHGASGHTEDRLYTEDVFKILKLPIANNLNEASEYLNKQNLCYLPLENFCSPLARIINLRTQFGLRSPVHSFSKLINPGNCPNMLISTFHPSYKPVHQEACALLHYQRAAIFKGESGEAEFRPQALVSVDNVINESMFQEQWPALMQAKTDKENKLNVADLTKAWRTDVLSTQLSKNTVNTHSFNAEYGYHAIIGTCAIALKLCGQAENTVSAMEMAQDMWQSRNKSLI